MVKNLFYPVCQKGYSPAGSGLHFETGRNFLHSAAARPAGKRMNLKYYLLTHILLTIALCLAATVGYRLYQHDRSLKKELRETADAVRRELQVQLLQINGGLRSARQFPDFGGWRERTRAADICMEFVKAETPGVYRLCRETPITVQGWPDFFARGYQAFFNPEASFKYDVAFNNRCYGTLTVSAGSRSQIARAWREASQLAALALMIGIMVSVPVYAVLNRALAPAKVITGAIDKMRGGCLETTLPGFGIDEWRVIGTALTTLALDLKNSLKERRQLLLRLFTAQEQERRWVARELHDELGQYLAAAGAVIFALRQNAERESPGLAAEIERLDRINKHVMAIVGSLLRQLRPAALDEIGLRGALESLIADWRSRTGAGTRYDLTVVGDCRNLPEPLPIVLYRIVQEGLTNIAKHSVKPSRAGITLAVGARSVFVRIEDNGADSAAADQPSGLGLIGIRERVAALNGKLSVNHGASGFCLEVRLPLTL